MSSLPLLPLLGLSLLTLPLLSAAAAEPTVGPTSREGLVSLSLPALLGRQQPWLEGGGHLGRCAGAGQSLDAALDALQAAERAMAYLQHAEAERAFLDAEAALLCSAGPVAANIAARVPFLRGVEAALLGQGDEARAQFLAAHRIRPGIPWDENYPPEATLPFELARADAATEPALRLRLLPPPAEIWVDGRPADTRSEELLLGPGRHYIQVPAIGWLPLVVELPPQRDRPTDEPLRLFLPALVEAETLTWFADEHRRSELDGLLRGAVAPGTRLVIDQGGESFSGSAGEARWEPIHLETPRPGRVWRVAAWSGLALALDGAMLAVVGQAGMAKSAAAAEHSDTPADYRQARGAFDAWRGLGVAGLWVTGGGVLLCGGGVIGDARRSP
jgi:hypothetical protein